MDTPHIYQLLTPRQLSRSPHLKLIPPNLIAISLGRISTRKRTALFPTAPCVMNGLVFPCTYEFTTPWKYIGNHYIFEWRHAFYSNSKFVGKWDIFKLKTVNGESVRLKKPTYSNHNVGSMDSIKKSLSKLPAKFRRGLVKKLQDLVFLSPEEGLRFKEWYKMFGILPENSNLTSDVRCSTIQSLALDFYNYLVSCGVYCVHVVPHIHRADHSTLILMTPLKKVDELLEDQTVPFHICVEWKNFFENLIMVMIPDKPKPVTEIPQDESNQIDVSTVLKSFYMAVKPSTWDLLVRLSKIVKILTVPIYLHRTQSKKWVTKINPGVQDAFVPNLPENTPLVLNYDGLDICKDGGLSRLGTVSGQITCSARFNDGDGDTLIRDDVPHAWATTCIAFMAWPLDDRSQAQLVGFDFIENQKGDLIRALVIHYHRKMSTLGRPPMMWISDNHQSNISLRLRLSIFTPNALHSLKKFHPVSIPIELITLIFNTLVPLLPTFLISFTSLDIFTSQLNNLYSTIQNSITPFSDLVTDETRSLVHFISEERIVLSSFSLVDSQMVINISDPIHVAKCIRNSYLSNGLFSSSPLFFPYSLFTSNEDGDATDSNMYKSESSSGRFVIEILYLTLFFDENNIIKFCPRLSAKTINPTSREKMRFNLVSRFCEPTVIQSVLNMANLLDSITRGDSNLGLTYLEKLKNERFTLDEVFNLILCEKRGKIPSIISPNLLPSALFPDIFTILQTFTVKDFYATCAGLIAMFAYVQITQLNKSEINSFQLLCDTFLLWKSLSSFSAQLGGVGGFLSSASFHGIQVSLVGLVAVSFVGFEANIVPILRHLNQDLLESTFSTVRAMIGKRTASANNIKMSLERIVTKELSANSIFSPNHGSHYSVDKSAHYGIDFAVENPDDQNSDVIVLTGKIPQEIKDFISRRVAGFSDPRLRQNIPIPLSKTSLFFNQVSHSSLKSGGFSYIIPLCFKTGILGRVSQSHHEYPLVRQNSILMLTNIQFHAQKLANKRGRGENNHNGPTWGNSDTLNDADQLSYLPFSSSLENSGLSWDTESSDQIVFHICGWILRDIVIRKRCFRKYSKFLPKFPDFVDIMAPTMIQHVVTSSGIVFPSLKFFSFFKEIYFHLKIFYFNGPVLNTPLPQLRNCIYDHLRHDKFIRGKALSLLESLSEDVAPDALEFQLDSNWDELGLALLQLTTESLICTFLNQISKLNKSTTLFGGKYTNRAQGIRAFLSVKRSTCLFSIVRPLSASDLRYSFPSSHLSFDSDMILFAMPEYPDRVFPQCPPWMISTLLGYNYPSFQKTHSSQPSNMLSSTIESQLISDYFYSSLYPVHLADRDREDEDLHLTDIDMEDEVLDMIGEDDFDDGAEFSPSIVQQPQIHKSPLLEEPSLRNFNVLENALEFSNSLTLPDEISSFLENSSTLFQSTSTSRKWLYWFMESMEFENAHIRDSSLNHLVTIRYLAWQQLSQSSTKLSSFQMLSDRYSIQEGTFLDVQDEFGTWALAVVKSRRQNMLNISFIGWDASWDQKMSIFSEKIERLYYHTKGKWTGNPDGDISISDFELPEFCVDSSITSINIHNPCDPQFKYNAGLLKNWSRSKSLPMVEPYLDSRYFFAIDVSLPNNSSSTETVLFVINCIFPLYNKSTTSSSRNSSSLGRTPKKSRQFTSNADSAQALNRNIQAHVVFSSLDRMQRDRIDRVFVVDVVKTNTYFYEISISPALLASMTTYSNSRRFYSLLIHYLEERFKGTQFEPFHRSLSVARRSVRIASAIKEMELTQNDTAPNSPETINPVQRFVNRKGSPFTPVSPMPPLD